MLEEAELLFGDRLPIAQRYAEFLAGPGLERGLLGPRELPRIWERHLLNCAVLTELLPEQARVVDIGSGAGLPGLVLACRRPDLRVDLVESLQRRVDFLAEAVELLDLAATVRVVHGRAEDPPVVAAVGSAQWVTARAVAPLDRLVRWCLPLLDVGGSLLAMKGESAEQELAEHRTSIKSLGGSTGRLVECGSGVITPPLRVVVIERERLVKPKKGRVSR
ncbi:16S rRNA m(7)G-527 methyltransferase [Frankineae bacterium MT45]|nr:16S rRNA m(7)G-527 methyltransferase [Frankineae bacterium MT45]